MRSHDRSAETTRKANRSLPGASVTKSVAPAASARRTVSTASRSTMKRISSELSCAAFKRAHVTTAAGLSVAIPALIGYRYLRGRIDRLVVQMEKEALKLIEAMESDNVS